MAGVIDEILAEYQRMRGNGLKAKDTLRALRSYIAQLKRPERYELARQIIAWESGGEAKAGEEQMADFSTDDDTVVLWLRCPSCGKTNQRHEVFCYACGFLLESAQGGIGTRTFGTTKLRNPESFRLDSVLALQSADDDRTLELRPQRHDYEMILGRVVAGSSVKPDVDLDGWNGERHGISRLHMALRFDGGNETLSIADLGSVNGSQLNGQKLYPQEVRILRDGDELRLGTLAVHAHFRHPGAET